MATIDKPMANDVCAECEKEGTRTPALAVILVEVGDVTGKRIPQCKRHLLQLKRAMQELEALLG